jgi:DNA-directed RNA polymerase specialized sigma24 family protein
MQLSRQIDTLFRTGTASGLTDERLLDRFVHKRDEGAFAALVDRHAAMVLRVSRQVLGDEHDAQDASQATFLVLARKAGTIGRRESVGCWLHGVALRVAAKARVAAARRRAHERRGATLATGRMIERPATTPEDRERWASVHEELGRLPEAFRAPLVLCYSLTSDADQQVQIRDRNVPVCQCPGYRTDRVGHSRGGEFPGPIAGAD